MQGGNKQPVYYHNACFINFYKHSLKTELHPHVSDISLSLSLSLSLT